MAKGIIIVDKPEKCQECTYKDEAWDCALQPYHFDEWDEQFKGCPIKPMPDIKPCEPFDIGQCAFERGYNACIEEILGKE